MKIIEELQSALGKEQQLRLIYEQKLIDLKTTLSNSLGFGSLPCGINLDRSESKSLNLASTNNIFRPPTKRHSPAFNLRRRSTCTQKYVRYANQLDFSVFEQQSGCCNRGGSCPEFAHETNKQWKSGSSSLAYPS
jgi:hypothetical protein